MAVKVRFTRVGKKHAPMYRIVAIDSRAKRDGGCLEHLGTYNPKTKKLEKYEADRVAYWASVGAIFTDSVQRLVKLYNKSQASQAQAAPKKDPKATGKTVEVGEKVEKKAAPKKAASKAAPKKEAAVEKKETTKAAPKKAVAKKEEAPAPKAAEEKKAAE